MNMSIDERVNNLIRLLQERYISQKSETVRETGDMLEINGLVQTDLRGTLCPILERRGILRRGIYQLPGDQRRIGTNAQILRRQEILEQIENLNRKSIFYNTNLEERIREEKKLLEELEECGKVVQIYSFDIDKDRLFDDTLFLSKEKASNGPSGENLNKGIFLHQLPRGTKWKNITISFIDEETARISVHGKTVQQTYKEMKFVDKRSDKPNLQWKFLLKLARDGGEFIPTNPKEKADYEKTKQALSMQLEQYFGLDYDDPFFPYDHYLPDKRRYSYKLKMTIFLTTEMQKNLKIDGAENDISQFYEQEVSRY